MCGRYRLPEDPDELLERVLEDLNRAPVKASGEVFPSDVVPVMARSRSGNARGFAMRWGFEAQGRLIINARSETAAQKPLFRESAAQRRCLVPLSGYYEWHRTGSGAKYFIAPGEAAWLAGLYRLTDAGPEFTVLTRAPGDGIAWLHDRMPVLLPRRAWDGWLDPHSPFSEALDHAVTDVRYEAAGDIQLAMDL